MIEKIAEFMGWEKCDYGCCKPYYGIPGIWRNTGLHAKGTVKESHLAVAYYLDKFNPVEDWGFWMSEVEPRIRERELWGEYTRELMNICDDFPHWNTDYGRQHNSAMKVLSATLDQRAQALVRVLDGSQTQEDRK